jgi:hypothetical protein
MMLGSATSADQIYDAVAQGAERLGNAPKREHRKTLVLSRADGSRAVVDHSVAAGELRQHGAVLELWDEPMLTRVIMVVDDKSHEQDVLLDYNVDLCQMVSVIQSSFKSKLPVAATPMVFSMRSDSEPERWLKLNLPLNQQRLGVCRLVARRVVDLTSPAALVVGGALGAGGSLNGDASALTAGEARAALAPTTADAADAAIHRVSMSIQSRRHERHKLSTAQELWCVLKDNLLLLYTSAKDTVPVQCLTLELFVALSISLLKGRRAIVLRRSNRQVQVAPAAASTATLDNADTIADATDVDFYLLQPPTDDVQRFWLALLRRRCLSGRRRACACVSARDDAWARAGAKVFGAPLDEVLERQQRKPPIPKLVEALVGYLEGNALPARVERLLLHPPTSRTLLECYRADIDQGAPLDLSACRDPWTVAALLRQVCARCAALRVRLSLTRFSCSTLQSCPNRCSDSTHTNGSFGCSV